MHSPGLFDRFSLGAFECASHCGQDGRRLELNPQLTQATVTGIAAIRGVDPRAGRFGSAGPEGQRPLSTALADELVGPQRLAAGTVPLRPSDRFDAGATSRVEDHASLR